MPAQLISITSHDSVTNKLCLFVDVVIGLRYSCMLRPFVIYALNARRNGSSALISEAIELRREARTSAIRHSPSFSSDRTPFPERLDTGNHVHGLSFWDAIPLMKIPNTSDSCNSKWLSRNEETWQWIVCMYACMHPCMQVGQPMRCSCSCRANMASLCTAVRCRRAAF